ncbi:hypothetical protein SDJN03_10229, partial [Cucurbita argyrosperma subsp. sororia]
MIRDYALNVPTKYLNHLQLPVKLEDGFNLFPLAGALQISSELHFQNALNSSLIPSEKFFAIADQGTELLNLASDIWKRLFAPRSRRSAPIVPIIQLKNGSHQFLQVPWLLHECCPTMRFYYAINLLAPCSPSCLFWFVVMHASPLMSNPASIEVVDHYPRMRLKKKFCPWKCRNRRWK